MTDQHTRQILTINTGSSSIKAALYDLDGAERLTIAAQVERIGLSGSHIRTADAEGKTLLDEERDLPDHASGVKALFDWLHQHHLAEGLEGMGHRVVQGGSRYSEPHLIDDDL